MNNLFVSPITRFLPEILLYFLFTHVLSAVHPWANIQGETTKYWFADFSYLLLFMLQTVTQYPTEIQCTHEQVFGKELWNGRYLRDPNSIIFLHKSTASFFYIFPGPWAVCPYACQPMTNAFFIVLNQWAGMAHSVQIFLVFCSDHKRGREKGKLISHIGTGYFKFGCRVIFWSIYQSKSCRKSGLNAVYLSIESLQNNVHIMLYINICKSFKIFSSNYHFKCS